MCVSVHHFTALVFTGGVVVFTRLLVKLPDLNHSMKVTVSMDRSGHRPVDNVVSVDQSQVAV